MNVAYVCADSGIPILGGKGASVHVREIVRALAGRGHELLLAYATLGGGNPSPDARLFPLSADSAIRARELEAAFRAAATDVVIERYSLSSGGARVAADALGVPLVLEVNAPLVLEAARYRGLTGVEAALERERLVFSSADAIAVVSDALATYVEARAGGVPVRVIPNGVDAGRFAAARPAGLDLPRHTVRVGFVGSMRPWHGVADLVEAFATLVRIRPEAHLVIVGSGQDEAAVRARVTALGLGHDVSMLGACPHEEVPGILAALDVGVAPYRNADGFYFSSLKVLEYMAAGIPVAFPAIGDLPVTVGAAGIGYAAGDTSSLAAALVRLVEAPELRRRLGRIGRELAARRTWDAVAGRLEAMIESLRSAAGAAR